ncbi:Envelope-like protein [Abeliophyllum distichum]|uniref:Envelope-like protein n=1 Tax=Abeliophyllum distichum TaxID=126358 RepID=A0ABD1PBV2_9LAMI
MAPKRPPTTAEKGKNKTIGGMLKRPRVENTDSRHYLSEEHEERFKNFISHWTIWEKRRLQLDDFRLSELYNLVDICGSSKITDIPHKIYSQLVHEFNANFNQDIDIQRTEHYGQTWVRGKWFMFTPRIINNYYGITTEDIHHLLSIQDMGEVAQFLYGRDDAWPLPGKDFEHSKLTDSLIILNVFVSHNIDPTRHRTTINDARARLLYHLAHGRKMDLENYIYTLISMLGFQTDKRHTAIFQALISGICEAVGVQISPAEPVIKDKGPINRFALENARKHTVRAVGAILDAQDQPPEEHAVAPQPIAPQPAAPPVDITSMLRQILEGQAEHTRLIVATRTEMRTMQQELATLQARMDSFRHAQMNQESRQRKTNIEQRRIRADCNEVKKRLDRCTGQLDDIHDKICRPAPTPSQDPSPVDPTILFLPAPSDPHLGYV